MTETAAPGAWAALPPNARGAVWMLLAVLAFSFNNIAVKQLAAALDPVQVMFLRGAVMSALMLPVAWHSRALATRRLGAHLSRSLLGTAGAYLFILALTLAPLADVIALSFSRALFIIVLAVLLLGETVGWRRWTACAIGFIGVLVMVRPGFGALNLGLVAATCDAVLSAGVALTLKSLGRTERPQTVVFYYGLFSTVLTAIPALLVWRAPSAGAWLLVGVTGLLATAGQVAMTRAWIEGEASVVAPLAYTQLVLSGGLAFLFFGESPDRLALLGAAIIVASTLYIALREAWLRQAARKR
ncbi:MAG: DMT family transporter [Rhodospirillaceae bacterium]|nr:DMT family transporter [Rhodospirillaceae bacterium]